jgi:putative transposase
VTARERREVFTRIQHAADVSERRAIHWTGFSRSSMRYRSVRGGQNELRARIREIAGERVRWGYRRIHVLLRREGWMLNRKRVQRIYREENLGVRRKGRRRRSEAPRPVRTELGHVNERWSLDFVSDTLSSGRRFRALTVIDEYSRECPAIEVAYSIPAERVIQGLERLRETRSLPEVIITDDGLEFRSQAFDAWAYPRGVKLEYIQPGTPVRNSFIESLNGSLRDECLNQHWFTSLRDASHTIEAWRENYNRVRPHSSLGNLTPSELAEGVHREALSSLTHTTEAVRK